MTMENIQDLMDKKIITQVISPEKIADLDLVEHKYATQLYPVSDDETQVEEIKDKESDNTSIGENDTEDEGKTVIEDDDAPVVEEDEEE